MEQVSGKLAAGVTDSSVFSILTRPWLINKVTCGSMMTILDTSSTDVMVTVDICLIALLIANIILFSPLIFSDLHGILDGQLGDVFTQMQDKLDRVESNFYLDEKLEEFTNISHIEKTVALFKNVTSFEINFESLLNFTNLEQPLSIMNDIKVIFTNITEEAKAREAFEESLNIDRVPIDIYKFPEDDIDPYDSVYAGFEAVKDEIIDLSGFTKNDQLEFHSLPRSFPQSLSRLEVLSMLGLRVLSVAVKIEHLKE